MTLHVVAARHHLQAAAELLRRSGEPAAAHAVNDVLEGHAEALEREAASSGGTAS